MCDSSRLDVLKQPRDRLARILLVRADDPGRPALDPAGAVGALHAGDAAAVVADGAAGLVEREVGQRGAAVAHAAKDEAAVERLVLVGRHRDEAAVLLLAAVAHKLDRRHPALAADRDGRAEEEEPD